MTMPPSFELPKPIRKQTGTIELVVDGKTGEVRQAGADRQGEFVKDFRALAERDLYTFAIGVMGYDLLSESLHLPFCRLLQTIPPRRKLVLMPRGHLKTTVMKSCAVHMTIQPDGANVYFPSGRIGNLRHSEGSSTRILFGSKGAELACAALGEVMQHYESNPLLRGLWPHCTWQEPKRQAKYWSAEHIQLPRREILREATIETVGVGGTITGFHFNVHMFDDLIDIKDANSPATMQAAIEWHKASRALMDNLNDSLELLIGTRWAVGDLYEYIQKNDPTVEVYRRSIIEHGKIIFPEVMNNKVIRELRDYWGPALFALLYHNDATDPELVDFDIAQLRECVIGGGYIRFAEGFADRAMQERRETANALMEHGAMNAPAAPKRGTLLSDGYDVMLEREKYIKTRHVRSC